jgi:hypothetical protein
VILLGREYSVFADIDAELWWTDTKSGLRMTHIVSLTVRTSKGEPGAWILTLLLFGLKLSLGSRPA